MHVRLATAIVMAAALAAAGLSAMPYAGASQNNCANDDFDIASSELLASDRPLASGAKEIGLVELSTLDSDRELNIELTDEGSGGEVTWTVYQLDGSCVEYTDNTCDQKNTLDREEESATCDIVAPTSGDPIKYFVHFEETSDVSAIEYMTWAPTS